MSLCALVMMLAGVDGRRFKLWIRHEAQDREGGTPCSAGLAALGAAPADMLFVQLRDVSSVLQAALEGGAMLRVGGGDPRASR